MEMIQIKGFISSIGFSDGNRFVIGHWKESPIGEFGDIMWGTPDGEKILVAGNEQVAEFVSCLLYTSPSPRDLSTSRMPSSA